MARKLPVLRLSRFYLRGFEDFPREIRTKMYNLFLLSVVGLCAFTVIFVRAIWFEFDVFNIVGSLHACTILGLTLVFIRLRRPVVAGNLATCMMFYIFITVVLRDIFTTEVKQISRINDSAVEILFGLLIISTYVIRKGQYIFAIFSGYFVLVAHYVVVMFTFFGGNFCRETVLPFVETIAILTASYLFSFTVLSLTTQSRADVFSNVIFYKTAKEGPFTVYAEHPLLGEDEENAGAYFYTLIGQGSKYSTGFFGPIPFGSSESNQVALVHASSVKDKHLLDPRMKQENYLLIALITTPEKIDIIDRARLEELLHQLCREISDLADLDAKHFQDMIARIRAG